MFEELKSLPESLPASELKKYFYIFLDITSKTNYSTNEALEVLLELADKQWHTYELIDPNLKNEVENWLARTYCATSLQCVELAISIAARLGLSSTYVVIKNSLNSNLSSEVRLAIEEAIEELDKDINDPYHGMR